MESLTNIYRQGDQVHHPKFGPGKVLRVSNHKISVIFKDGLPWRRVGNKVVNQGVRKIMDWALTKEKEVVCRDWKTGAMSTVFIDYKRK